MIHCPSQIANRVRPAAAADVLRVVDMVEALREAVAGPVPVDRAHTAATVAGLIASDDGVVIVSPGGFIAGRLTPTIINPRPVAQELGWYAADGSGGLLLVAFEDWARARGAMRIVLSTGPEGPDMTRRGYRRAEQAWVK